MGFELDHIFVATDHARSAMDTLVAVGFVEGSPNVHPGQGTANVRLFFDNAFIELLYPTDLGEARSEAIARTALAERCSGHGSAFGVCLRPVDGETRDAPFPSWEYRPPYLPESLYIPMNEGSERPELPLLFVLPFGVRPDRLPPARRQPLDHPCGAREIVGLRLELATGADRIGGWLADIDGVEVVEAPRDLMRITLDGSGAVVDLRPQVPLVLEY